MLIGVPKEIKNHEYRVGLVPASVRELVLRGAKVLVQSGAGLGIGVEDAAYTAAGATIAKDAAEVFAKADMVVKVKEPQPQECRMLREGQVLFTYLHLAPDPEQTKLLLASKATCIAYETVVGRNGGLPLLAPMSEVAGRMSLQAAAHCLEKARGGRGVLLGGVPGVQAGNVVVLGAGMVGTNALQMAMGLGARVTILDVNTDRLRQIDQLYGNAVQTRVSNQATLEELLPQADAVIGGVLIPGAAAPKLITRALLKRMLPGSVIVDVAIDQGGCCETSRPTTHADPTFVEEGVVHYCVANMPGAVARTSTFALNNATLPYALALATKGWRQALRDDAGLAEGLNVHAGQLTCAPVGEALGLPSVSVASVL